MKINKATMSILPKKIVGKKTIITIFMEDFHYPPVVNYPAIVISTSLHYEKFIINKDFSADETLLFEKFFFFDKK